MTLDIESVLAGHQRITSQLGGPCWCGRWPTADHEETWMAHVAAVLREQIAAAQAEAWDEGWAIGYREHGDDRLAGHGIIVGPPTPNPYRAAQVAPSRVPGEGS